MSDSEAEIDYSEILKTLDIRNIFLRNQELHKELKDDYDLALRIYHEKRNMFLKIKEEFEIEQLEILKSNILFGDMKIQCAKQMETLQKLTKEAEDLKTRSLQKQAAFDSSCRMDIENINKISTDTNDETLQEKIKFSQCIVESSQNEVEILKYEFSLLLQKHLDSYKLGGMAEYTREIEENTMGYEQKLKRYELLRDEINQYEHLVENLKMKINRNSFQLLQY